MCQARQYSDQMVCGPCGLSWDTNDEDRPPCKVLAMPLILEPLATSLDIDKAMRNSGGEVGRFLGFDFGGPEDCEAVTVRQGDKIIAHEVSKPGKRITPEQWAELRRACGEKDGQETKRR